MLYRVAGLFRVPASFESHGFSQGSVSGKCQQGMGYGLGRFVGQVDSGFRRDQFRKQASPGGDHRDPASQGFPCCTAGSIRPGNQKKEKVCLTQHFGITVAFDVTPEMDAMRMTTPLSGQMGHFFLMSPAAKNFKL